MEKAEVGFSYVDFLLSLQRSVLRRPKGQVVGQVTPGALCTNHVTHTFSPKDGGPPGRTKWLIGVSLMVKRKPGTQLLLGMSKHPLPHSRQVSKRVVLNGKTTHCWIMLSVFQDGGTRRGLPLSPWPHLEWYHSLVSGDGKASKWLKMQGWRLPYVNSLL